MPEPIHFLELGSAAESLDLGSRLLLSQVKLDMLGDPLSAVARELDIFHCPFVRVVNSDEVVSLAAPIRMRFHRLDAIGGLHILERVGREQTQGGHELRPVWIAAVRRFYHVVMIPVGMVISGMILSRTGAQTQPIT